MQEWLRDSLGVDPAALHPSVRCGLEAALLTALAHSRGQSLAQALGNDSSPASAAQSSPSVSQPSAGGGTRDGGAAVAVNGLLGGEGGPEVVAAQAVQLAQRGFTTIKIKVRHRP